jgi:AraC-like DNA-binding protein
MQKLLIKNMVCPRCIQSVRTILSDMNKNVVDVQLGEAWIEDEMNDEELHDFKLRLDEVGFELLDDAKKQLIEQIKNILIQLIQNSESDLPLNYSDYLSQKIGKDYRYLSNLFSNLNGMTIEKYFIHLKVEKIKEYISYEELTISEIAYKMNYSSPAHLSRQFKQLCGFSPKEYKLQLDKKRKSLDQL